MTSGATMNLLNDYASQTLTARALAGLFAVGGAGLLLGCDGADDDVAAVEPPAAPADHDDSSDHDDGLALAPALDPSAESVPTGPVCPASRVTVLRASGACPLTVNGDFGKWDGGPLFPNSADIPALAAVCAYEWKPNATAKPDWKPLQVAPYTNLGSDCEVNWPQGDALSDLVAPTLRDAFFEHIGRIDAADLPSAAATPVTVVLPDTASHFNVPMNSDHAANMAGIIRSIACPTGAACNLTIERRLALPLLGDGVIDWDNGGYFGSQNHLALAIYNAVSAWNQGPGGPLILNLSLGWEPTKFGGTGVPVSMPAAVQGVFRTLQYARCRGAAIFVAAGNVAGDDCIEGPLAPARWEGVMGPTVAYCQSQFGVNPPWNPNSQPLVHAVGAVDHQERPLQSTRVEGRPRLAAPGFLAVADGPTGLTSAISGSSVATAVVSGTAALLWSRNSGQNAGWIFNRIYASAEPMLPTAISDFGPQGEIRRVSVCAAIDYACVGNTCPQDDCADTTVDVAALGIATADAAATLPANKPGLVDASAHVVADECPAMCTFAKLYTSEAVASGPNDPCELDLVDGRDRYTDPQPSYPPCKVCFASANSVVMLVEEDFDGLPVTSAVLEVTDGAHTERFQVGPISAGLSSTERTEILVPGTIDPLQERAILHLTFTNASGGTETHSNPISVY